MIFIGIVFGLFSFFTGLMVLMEHIVGLRTNANDIGPILLSLFAFSLMFFFVGMKSPTEEEVREIYYSNRVNNIEFSEPKKITEIEVKSANPLVFLKNETKYLVEEIDKLEL